MKTRSFSTLRLAAAALALCLPATAGWARGDASAPVSSSKTQAVAPAPAIADQLDALLTARFTAAESAAAGEARREALQSLSQFAAITVEGLIQASPSSEMRTLMDERLRPILVRHQANIAAALAGAVERPAARIASPVPSASDF